MLKAGTHYRIFQTFTDSETTHLMITKDKRSVDGSAHHTLTNSSAEYQALHAQYYKSCVVKRDFSVNNRGGTVHQKNLSRSVCLSQFGVHVFRLVHRHVQFLFLIY